MLSFNEWLNLKEGTPVGMQPSPAVPGTFGNPLASALLKIHRGHGSMPFDNNFTNPDVISNTFGFSPNEMAAVQKARLISRDVEGYRINKAMFDRVAQMNRIQLPNQPRPNPGPLPPNRPTIS